MSSGKMRLGVGSADRAGWRFQAVVRRWEAIANVLTSLGLSADGRVLARCRGPPEGQLELDFSVAAADRAA